MTTLTAPAQHVRNPVFIVGAPRSGTSILYRSLQLQGRFRLTRCTDPSGVQLAETHLIRRPYLWMQNERVLKNFYLNDEVAWSAFLQETTKVRRWQGRSLPLGYAYRGLGRLPVPTGWLFRIHGGEAVVRSFFNHAVEARGCARLVEKTPTNVGVVPHLRRLYPDAQFLFLCRHPVDTYSSYRRRANARSEGGKSVPRWLRLSITTFARRWKRDVTQAVTLAQALPDRVRIVAYEDLTMDPAGTLREVLAWLGEDFDAANLPTDGAGGPVNDNRQLFGTIQTGTKRWRDWMTEEEATTLERKLRSSMAAVGYGPHVSD